MVLSCDIGTSFLKLGIVDQSGKLRWIFRCSAHRSNANAWYASFLHSLVRIPNDLRKKITAIAVSGHGPTLVPIDKNGRTSADALLWFESPRNPGQAASDVSFFLPNLRRFHEEDPFRYEQTACFLPSGEYLVFRLTGHRTAVLPHDGFKPYYWLPDELSAAGLDPAKLPPFQILGKEAGRLSPEISRRTGISPDTRVYGCGVDFLMAILGSGCLFPGTTCDRGGTTEAINYCSSIAYSVTKARLVPGFHQGTFTVSGFIKDAGLLHARLKDRVLGRRASFAAFEALAQQALPGTGGVRFNPKSWAEHAGKVLSLSLDDSFYGINAGTTKGDLARAFLEYVACAVRRIVIRIEAAGANIATVRSTGGLARSILLCQLKADISGKEFSVPHIEDAELLGNALVALQAAGEIGSLDEGVRHLVRLKRVFQPEPGASRLYEDIFENDASACLSSGRLDKI